MWQQAVPCKPWDGSAHCTLRRDVLGSARSLSELKKFPLCLQKKPSYQQKEKVAREGQRVLLFATLQLGGGGSPSRQNP
jgi:hypothetical protein